MQSKSCCFADLDGRYYGDLYDLEDALKEAAKKPADGSSTGAPASPSSELFAFDHVYNPQQRGAPGALHVILYGPPGTECFSEMHRVIRGAMGEGGGAGGRPLVYAHRPLLGDACRASGEVGRVGGAAPRACALPCSSLLDPMVAAVTAAFRSTAPDTDATLPTTHARPPTATWWARRSSCCSPATASKRC